MFRLLYGDVIEDGGSPVSVNRARSLGSKRIIDDGVLAPTFYTSMYNMLSSVLLYKNKKINKLNKQTNK